MKKIKQKACLLGYENITMLGETNNQFSMALHLNDIKFFTCFYVHKDLRLIRFLPAPTARNVLDFNQNSLHLVF